MNHLFSFAIIAMLMTGCSHSGDGPQRRIVTGEVTFDGQPLEAGRIRFLPQPDGPVATAEIQKGRYTLTNKGGVPVGPTKVEIVGLSPTAGLSEDELLTHPPAAAPSIPARYNTQTELQETIPSGTKNYERNFQLTSEK